MFKVNLFLREIYCANHIQSLQNLFKFNKKLKQNVAYSQFESNNPSILQFCLPSLLFNFKLNRIHNVHLLPNI